jgi:hypothetical protein
MRSNRLNVRAKIELAAHARDNGRQGANLRKANGNTEAIARWPVRHFDASDDSIKLNRAAKRSILHDFNAGNRACS